MHVECYKPIFKLLGIALIAFGVFQALGGMDLVRALQDAAAKRELSLNFNLSPSLFLLIGVGVLLLFDIARAASIVRWFAIMVASALALYLLLTPVYIPLGYLLADLWLTPSKSLGTAAYFAGVFLALFAVIYLLSRPRLVAACAARGVRIRSALIPIACGALVAAPSVYFMATLLDGAFVKHAKEMAFEQAGPDYGYFIKSSGFKKKTTRGPGVPTVTTTSRTATVMAYNLHEIRQIRVEWAEQ